MIKKIIYDFGSNNGDDIPYYLLKADLVIAVEANPVLCEKIKSRFKSEISNGNLIVEQCVLKAGEPSDSVAFYIHKTKHVLSMLSKPANMSEFDEVYLPSKNVIELIRKYGDPYYIKIDIEQYDHVILRELFNNKIMPPYISAESHSIEVFASMIVLGKYNSFKLVDGGSVPIRYQNSDINTNNGNIQYSFPPHSAGPFGNDLSGPWMTARNFFKVLAYAGLGWKDVHASRIDIPDKNYQPPIEYKISLNL